MNTNEPSPAADPPETPAPRRRPPNWRLRVMVGFVSVSLALYVFVRLDRSTAEYLGPVGEGLHDLFNQVPGKRAPFTRAARKLSADVQALGGDPGVNVTKPGYFGTLGQEEWFNVSFHGPRLDDAAFAKLAEEHGDQIGGLYIRNTGLTDAGLKHLGKFTMLRHLDLRRDPPRKKSDVPVESKITDAGLVHMKGLDHLWTLNLDNLPITDAGLEALADLPELMALYLSNTKIEGPALSRLKSLPRLDILYVDGTRMTEGGLKALAGATALQILSLNRVPLEPTALPLLQAIPKLDRLEITGCGFLDEEVDSLKKARPKLRVIRN